jgi:TolB-like protein
MRLLLCLAQRAGEVVSIEDLLNEVWSGVIVTSDSVYQAVASLRRVLGDDPKRPSYIANVPRLGYRMVASVGLWVDEPGERSDSLLRGDMRAPGTALAEEDLGPVATASSSAASPLAGSPSAGSPPAASPSAASPSAVPPLAASPSATSPLATSPSVSASTPARALPVHSADPNTATSHVRAIPMSSAARTRRAILIAAGVLGFAFALTFLFRRSANLSTAPAISIAAPATGPIAPATQGTAPPKSVAVLPFLDLTTEDMKKEYFADGMTEELIDRLSKIPGLRVPGPTSSFYFKGKQLKVADIAKSLGVLYVLDGSIRKSDGTLRVAARLIRADDGYVIWSETYDRPLVNELEIQDEIAGKVAKTLESSIN